MSPLPTLLPPAHAPDAAEDVTTSIDRRHLPQVVPTVVIRWPLRPVPTARPAPLLTPQALARLHNAYSSALWRGDDVAAVTAWLAAHWQEQAPSEPEGEPDAVSLFGGTGCGRGIRWYQRHAAILGYPPGERRGCYLIPIAEVPPLVPGLRPVGAA